MAGGSIRAGMALWVAVLAAPLVAPWVVFGATLPLCGNGLVEKGETCDDDNRAAGDGCAGDCTPEPCFTCTGVPSVCVPATGIDCDDGNPCTYGTTCTAGACGGGVPYTCDACQICDGEGACLTSPRDDCRQAIGVFASKLTLRDSRGGRDVLNWIWRHGQATAASDFGDPLTSTTFNLCAYDGALRLLMRADAPAGGQCGRRSCWSPWRGGFAYKNRAGAPNGLQTMQLAPGGDGVAQIVVRGRGPNLPMPALAFLQLPLTMQLQVKGGACWEATFAPQGVVWKEPKRFVGKSAPQRP